MIPFANKNYCFKGVQLRFYFNSLGSLFELNYLRVKRTGDTVNTSSCVGHNFYKL